MIVAAALLAGPRLLSHGSGPAGAGPTGTGAAGTGAAGTGSRAQGGAADVFGIRTTSAGCPAAALRAARARCPASPECFGGLVVSAGSATAERLPAFISGTRVYRCLAREIGHQPRTSQFRR